MLVSAFGWYGAVIGTGMLICVLLAYFMAKRRGYDTDIIFTIAVVSIPLAIIGARTYYVVNDVITDIANKGFTDWTIARYFGFENGKFVGFAGLAIYGGLLGGVIGAALVRLFNRKKPKIKQMTFIQMADLCFCLIILGQAIGRWGNFANQEAYGQLITDPAWQWFPFAVKIDAYHGIQGAGWYHACFFYESLWNLIGFALLQFMYNGKYKSFDGFHLSFYCMWYGFIRFIVESLRSDSMWFGPIKANQLLSLLIFFAGAGILFFHIYNAKKANKKLFILVREDKLDLSYYGYEKSFLYTKKQYLAEESQKAVEDGPISESSREPIEPDGNESGDSEND